MKKHIDTISKHPAAKDATPPVPPAEEKPQEATPAATPEPPKDAPAPAEEKPAEAAVPAVAPAAAAGETPVEGTPIPPDATTTDSFETMFPEPNVAISGPPSWIWWILLILAAAILAFVGYSLAKGKLNGFLGKAVTPTPTATISASPSASASATPSATPTATASASATPTASPSSSTVVKSAVTLRVLNGTTVTGAAGTAKSVLEKAGFTVRTTGNAKNQNYTSTYVYYQTGKQAEAEAVKAALTGYSVTLEESSSLANPDNVLVVVGKK